MVQRCSLAWARSTIRWRVWPFSWMSSSGARAGAPKVCLPRAAVISLHVYPNAPRPRGRTRARRRRRRVAHARRAPLAQWTRFVRAATSWPAISPRWRTRSRWRRRQEVAVKAARSIEAWWWAEIERWKAAGRKHRHARSIVREAMRRALDHKHRVRATCKVQRLWRRGPRQQRAKATHCDREDRLVRPEGAPWSGALKWFPETLVPMRFDVCVRVALLRSFARNCRSG